ncbi:MAG: hypothetical protein HYY93_08260 [Planctomycetes bacterium]|nr:hypothetical protein [Planctomycetota bacterium]
MNPHAQMQSEAAAKGPRPMREVLPSAPRYSHPGEKLAKEGPETLSDEELLAILISSGGKGRSAEQIAGEIVHRFGSIEGMMNKPLEWFYDFKGMGDVKIIRLAAAFEIGRRLWGRKAPAHPTKTHP